MSIRIGMVFAMTPILTGMPMPASVRIMLVLGLAVALGGVLPNTTLRGAVDASDLLRAVGIEFSIGVVLALGVTLAFATFSVAGRILDIQIGFGIGQLFDPATRQNLPILTGAFSQLGLLCFFAVNGHHTVLRALAYSFEQFPMGEPWPLSESLPVVLRHAAGVFALGFSLVAPVVTCLLLVELGLGVVARNLPQMNMFVMGMPVKVIVGLSALAAWIGGAGDVVSRIFTSVFRGWEALFR
ncbi:flagellar biosynthetic protein FliR [Cupriavidus sp. 30B13]|uniref:flagellar biosynthetic protein FliR n=1 Tax=Cupriavidus sp. 30B13 TaxID=3384241 RepID=UPI003CEE7C65